VEFPDNLHGLMTNPRLFKKYCLPHYQKYTEILHSQGKKVGSHMDGELKQLLGLITETGLDICESFSPFPLTGCLLKEALQAWQNGPMIWGGIPSTLLEDRTSQSEFEDSIDQILDLVKEGPFILGVVDLFMRHNSLERVRYIATRL
jgi:uroporphyrinogen-III decarboxylase